MRNIIAAFAVAVLLAGCGGTDEASSETEEGTIADYDLDSTGGDAEVRISGEDGEELVINSGSGTQVDLPDGFSLYPGSTVVSTTTMAQADGQGSLVIMQSDASAEQMVTFYRRQAEAAGIEIGMEMNSNGNLMIAGESDEGATFSFNASSAEDGTTGQLVVGQGLN